MHSFVLYCVLKVLEVDRAALVSEKVLSKMSAVAIARWLGEASWASGSGWYFYHPVKKAQSTPLSIGKQEDKCSVLVCW